MQTYADSSKSELCCSLVSKITEHSGPYFTPAMHLSAQDRWEIVLAHKREPNKSLKALAAQFHTSVDTVRCWIKREAQSGDVADAARSGRPRALDATALQQIHLAQLAKEFCTTRELASLLRARGTVVSRSTLCRALKAAGSRFKAPRYQPFISDKHAQKRVAFCRRNERKNWQGTIFTDSKYVQLTPSGAFHHRWVLPGEINTRFRQRHSAQLHFYAGVTFYGVTPLMFVTCSGGQKSSYINPKTNAPHSGVCAKEYLDIALNYLIPAAKQLFAQDPEWATEWEFQQDGAPPHRTDTNLAQIKAACPRMLSDWPPCSPDLSWIENMWSILQRRVRAHPPCANLAELTALLQQEWAAIPLRTLRKAVWGMRARMEKCVALNGACIGK
jgi:transposase